MADSFSEEDWQAEMDADTLVRAREIKADAQRVTRAKEHLTEKAKKLQKEAGEIGGGDAMSKGYTRLGGMND